LKIRWSKGAEKNLDEVESYIARDKPGAAVKTVIVVIDAVGRLAENPAMGRPGRVEGTRELIIPGTPFIVPYRVRKNTVEILRVFHHARKWPEKI
jgi:toxin ParE1/3/4